MSPVFHFFKKDLRRTQLLIAVWLLLVVVQYALMATSFHSTNRLTQFVVSAVAGSNGFPLRWLIVAVLVALLVQEETPAGTTGFWLTRPMARSSVLQTKLIALALLVTVPLLVELAVLASGGATGHDLALAAPEIILQQLQVIALIALLAALTPSFARFAIAGAIVLVAQTLVSLLGNWASTLLHPDSGFYTPQTQLLYRSREIVREVVLVAGLGGVFIYQYLARRTSRAIVAAVAVEIVVTIVGFTWPWSFFALPLPAASTLTVDPATIHTTLMESRAQEQQNYEPVGEHYRNISAQFYLDGIPPGYVAMPRDVHARLTRADGGVLPTSEPGQSDSVLSLNSDLIEAAMGSVFVYGHAWDSSTTPSGLVRLDAATFRQNAEQKLNLSADLDFDLNQYVVLDHIPLAHGAQTRQGSEREVVADVLREGRGIKVEIERSTLVLQFANPARVVDNEMYKAYVEENAALKTFVLYNRGTHEVVRVQSNNGVQQIGQARHNGRLVQESWELSFGPDEYAPTPTLDDAWLASAELVHLELRRAATIHQTVSVNDFVLNGQNRPHIRLPADPPTRPEWLSRFTLPDPATDIQRRAYVNSIVSAAAYWHAPSGTEVPVAMLAKVSPGHVNVLVDALQQTTSQEYQANQLLTAAILRAAGPDDKAAVLRALPNYTELIEVVFKYHWEADCRETLMAAIRDAKRTDLPRSWIRAAAALNDPATYPDLKAYLVRGPMRQATYNAIKNLPGIDLGDTVARAWHEAQSGSHAAQVDAALMAVDAGFLDALATLFEVLRVNDPGRSQDNEHAQTLITRYTPARGDATALVRWYDANKGRIAFNAETRRYYVTGAVPKP